MFAGDAPAFTKYLSLLWVRIGSRNQFDIGRGSVSRGVAVGKVDRSPLLDFVIEGASNSAEADNSGCVGFVHG